MIRQESLAPDSDALPRSTVESRSTIKGIVVRHRDGQGYTTRKTFKDPEEAHRFFIERVNLLRIEARRAVKMR